MVRVASHYGRAEASWKFISHQDPHHAYIVRASG